MSLALTIFGVSTASAQPVFCYGFLRPVRGPGDYPLPNLPKGLTANRVTRTPLPGFQDVELVGWDCAFPTAQEEIELASFSDGKLNLPTDCPVEPGRTVEGDFCPPSVIFDHPTWVRTSGTGILQLQSLIARNGIDPLVQVLTQAVGLGNAPTVLLRLTETLAKQSGLEEVFLVRRPIGSIDLFWRVSSDCPFSAPLLNIVPEKPDFRTKAPMLKCYVRRYACGEEQAFRLHVTVKNFDEILRDYLVDFPAGTAEVTVDASVHITDLSIDAFNEDGSIAQKIIAVFTQAMNFGITAQGRADLLPAVFRSTPETQDLEKRARLSTVAVKGPAAGMRSGAFDVLRQNKERVDALLGPQKSPVECFWFDRSPDSQINVICWIKTKLEQPNVRNAYLLDPFLSSDALRRVILRQGNENIDLTLLVSPGRVDPDADTVDVEAIENHIRRLVNVANEWSAQLCGNISIIHIKRGEDKRQAFHDRYLCLVGQDGVPTVHLLSNSLSKAAGDWPFAISELSRITAWRAYRYIQDLIAGKDGERELQVVEVWRRKQSTMSSIGVEVKQPEQSAKRPQWVPWAESFLKKLQTVAYRNTGNHDEMDATVDQCLVEWPTGVDTTVLANNVFQVLSYRARFVARVAARFLSGSDEQQAVGARLEDLLLDQFFGELTKGDRTHGLTWQFLAGRDELIAFLGRAISRLSAPTNFVRDRINPLVHSLIQTLEFQRGEYDATFNAVQIATCLISLGLEIAVVSAVELRFREGVACDYVHWAGRLMRSDAARIRLALGADASDLWMDDFTFLARQILQAKSRLGEPVQTASLRVLGDPLVASEFKRLLGPAAK